MQIQLAIAAANMAPRGFKIRGYEIRDARTGNAMMSRGKGDKQEHIRDNINKYAEMRDTIDFVLYLVSNSGEESETITRYEWDSNEAVVVHK